MALRRRTTAGVRLSRRLGARTQADLSLYRGYTYVSAPSRAGRRPERAQPATRRYLTLMVRKELPPPPAGRRRRRIALAVTVALVLLSLVFPLALTVALPTALITLYALLRNYRADAAWQRQYVAALDAKLRAHNLR